MQFEIADRLQWEHRQQSDRISRLEARVDRLCSELNLYCANVREVLGMLGGNIVEPSATLGVAQPSSAESAEPCEVPSTAHPVEVPELDLNHGLTAGPKRTK